MRLLACTTILALASGGDGGRRSSPSAKRELLRAVLDRADRRGGIAIMNAVLSDALTYDRADACYAEVSAVVQSIARGRTIVSPPLRDFVAARAGRFGGRLEAAELSAAGRSVASCACPATHGSS